jgi:hypothetical protein
MTKKPDDKLHTEAKAYARKAVEKANALRTKAKSRALPPRDEVRVYQAAFNEYLRSRGTSG